MIRKIFIGILSFTILIQTVIVSNFNVVYATTEEHKQEAIKLEKKSTNNNIICIKGAVKDKEYKLSLPKSFNLDEKKTGKEVEYNKEKNELTIIGTGEEIALYLLASQTGTYELELKEGDKVQAKLDLIVNNVDEEVAKTAEKSNRQLLRSSISDKLFLQADSSKATLANYTEQITFNYSINFLDGSTTLKNGKLVIDFNNSNLELVNYPKDTAANRNIKSTSYSALTGKLTINLVDNISSGAPFDIPIVVRAGYGAKPGLPMNLKATLSGENSSGGTYTPSEKTTTVNLEESSSNQDYSPITAGDNSWAFNLKELSYSLKPGGYTIQWPEIQKKSLENKSFKNLKLEYLKENGGDVISVNTADPYVIRFGEPFWSQLSTVNGKANVLVNDDEKQVVEYGPINANIYQKIQVSMAAKIPADGVEGTEYTGTVNVYDEDVFITSIKIKAEVADSATSIAVDSKVSKTSISEGDIFEWGFMPRVSSAAPGVNDLEIVAPIPEGIKALSYIPNNNSMASIKKLEYYQNGKWVSMAPQTSSGWDFSKIDQSVNRIEKLKLTSRDGIINDKDMPPYTHGTIRMQNIGVKAGESFTLRPESITYTDPDKTSKTIDTTTNSYGKNVQVVEKTSAPAKINGEVFLSSTAGTSGKGFGSTIFFNGDKIAQSVRLGSYGSKLENPYIFVVVPKGIDLETMRNFIQQPYRSTLNYTYAPANGTNTLYPKSSADVKGKETLSDGSTLYYWEAPDTGLAPGMENCEMLALDLVFKLNKANSGANKVEFGMGSMTDSSWNLNGAANSGLETKELSSELQSKLPGVTSTKYLSTTRTANIGVSNSIATKMKIKGSQDSDFVDVSAKTATTIPGKRVDYNLTFENNGTRSMKNLEIIDILPHKDDQYVLGTGPRGSKFSVIPTSEIEVLVNGKKSDSATLEYSTSYTPERFDTNGEDVAGDSWQIVAPTNMADVKSFRIKLPNTEFKVGDEITLNFEAIVPTDAPRNDEIAYNSIAYRIDKETGSGTSKLASEPPRGGVKSTNPSTDLNIAGNSFSDLNKNGVKDADELGLNAVKLDLYKKNNNEFEKVETVYTSSDALDKEKGLFDFNGLNNGTYKIAAHLPNKNADFITTGPNKIVKDSKDDSIGWITVNNSTEFTIDDLANGNPKNLVGIQIPIYMATPIKGAVVFVNKDGEPKITSYGQDYEIALFDKDGKEVQSAIKTNSKGEFSFNDVAIKNPADFKLKVTAPTGTNFVYSAKNPLFNMSTKEYTLNSVVPGVGGVAEIYITETSKPTTKIILDKAVTPNAITIESSDEATEVTNEWTLEDSDGTVVYTGTGNTIRIPNDEGTYIAKNTATDEAGNTASDEKTFDIDYTVPTLTVNQDASAEVNSTEANIGWIKPLNVAATDTHDGNITPVVDYSKVKWDVLGTYPVTVTATDASGNKATQTVNLRIVDTTSPTILITNNPLTYSIENMRKLTEQELYTAAGLIGGDNYDLAPGQAVQPNKQPMVFTSNFSTIFGDIASVKAGQYQVQVNLADSSGNQAIPQTITINVVDTVGPVIKADNVSYHVNTTKTEAEFFQDARLDVTDNNDDTTDLIITSNFAEKVNLNKPGKYEVTITATDTKGNQTTKEITVQVSKDKPVITADPKISYQGKTEVTEANFLSGVHTEVTDELDGDVKITSDFAEKVDFNKVGTYTVTLNAKDEYGNTAEPVRVSVNIFNKIAPTFNNADNKTIEAVNELPSLESIFKIEAKDYLSGNKLKVTYTPEQTIKGNVPGEYSIKVTTKDDSGNTAETTVTLTIKDTTGPSIKIAKSTNKLEVQSKAPNWITFFGIKATDIVDGDVTKNIKVDSSEVNLNNVGTYPIYFTVTDALGNESSKLKSTVQIVDTSSPILTIDKVEISYPKGKTVSDKQFLQDIGTKVTNSYGTVKVTTNLSKIVDWDKAGQYKVTVTATNSSGGVAEKTILLTVKNTDSSFIAVPSKDDNKNKPAKNIPKTGDTLNTELIVMGMMLLLVGGWMFLRRKTKVKTK
ncbi:LPXTG cell wall anchor domain-containing protein [Listeria monocytogenes]|uniref:LapB repeat-containing protein n=1 Tax=Listeria monocytogenes TaxID=1639 RepID=UPI0011EB6A4C|nr:LapB repeat-containing protein [Listeria monocytogenes]TYV72103.1 LPXTG cell wall anchor domain-containing protein [Listeria monocytogenes]